MKVSKTTRVNTIKNRMDRLTNIFLSLPKSGNVQATVNRIKELRAELNNQLKAL